MVQVQLSEAAANLLTLDPALVKRQPVVGHPCDIPTRSPRTSGSRVPTPPAGHAGSAHLRPGVGAPIRPTVLSPTLRGLPAGVKRGGAPSSTPFGGGAPARQASGPRTSRSSRRHREGVRIT